MGLLDANPQDRMSATPRQNRLLGLLADGVGAVDQFARKPFGYDNPPAGLLSDFLAVPQIQRTLDRMSYGEPLTTGRGLTTQLRPDTTDAALAVAPAVAKWPKQVLGVAAAVSGGAISPETQAMNILFKKGTWADRARILDDGTVEIPTMGFSSPAGQFRDKAFDLATEKYSPKYEGYFRFTNNAKEPGLAERGMISNSKNHADGTNEIGVSVAAGPHYGMFYKNGYQLTGDVVGYGSDGEPLLNPKTIKVLSKLRPSSEIMEADRTAQAKILQDNNLPPDYFSTFNFLNDPVTFEPRGAK